MPHFLLLLLFWEHSAKICTNHLILTSCSDDWMDTYFWHIYYHAAIFVDEDDVATYTIKSIDDPRTLNKTIYIRPQENILTQNEVIAKWEKLSGKVLEKIHVHADEFLASMKGNCKNYCMFKDNVYMIKNTFCVINGTKIGGRVTFSIRVTRWLIKGLITV